jgi:hypothetical protein
VYEKLLFGSRIGKTTLDTCCVETHACDGSGAPDAVETVGLVRVDGTSYEIVVLLVAVVEYPFEQYWRISELLEPLVTTT